METGCHEDKATKNIVVVCHMLGTEDSKIDVCMGEYGSAPPEHRFPGTTGVTMLMMNLIEMTTNNLTRTTVGGNIAAPSFYLWVKKMLTPSA